MSPRTPARCQTPCSICGRWVGVSRSWNDEINRNWKVHRHAATDPPRTGKGPRRPICSGGGIVVPAALVFPRTEDAA